MRGPPPASSHVLVVEPDPRLRAATASGLAEAGFAVRETGSVAGALAELAVARFDAVLVEVELPDGTGFDLQRALAVRDEGGEVAVLCVSGTRLDESSAVRAFEAGASDYLRRPFGLGELRARLVAAISNRRTIAALREQGRMDELTGLANRRAFFEALERERRRAGRDGAMLALVLLDVDRFKEVNDRYGHAAGDSALRTVGGVLAGSCRATDVAGRIGGEEFALVLPATDDAGARGLAEKLRASIAATPVRAGGEAISITASFGTAAAHGSTLAVREGALSLLALADAALYRAKRAGRDRVDAA